MENWKDNYFPDFSLILTSFSFQLAAHFYLSYIVYLVPFPGVGNSIWVKSLTENGWLQISQNWEALLSISETPDIYYRGPDNYKVLCTATLVQPTVEDICIISASNSLWEIKSSHKSVFSSIINIWKIVTLY
jgi:hypothetical protein